MGLLKDKRFWQEPFFVKETTYEKAINNWIWYGISHEILLYNNHRYMLKNYQFWYIINLIDMTNKASHSSCMYLALRYSVMYKSSCMALTGITRQKSFNCQQFNVIIGLVVCVCVVVVCSFPPFTYFCFPLEQLMYLHKCYRFCTWKYFSYVICLGKLKTTYSTTLVWTH